MIKTRGFNKIAGIFAGFKEVENQTRSKDLKVSTEAVVRLSIGLFLLAFGIVGLIMLGGVNGPGVMWLAFWSILAMGCLGQVLLPERCKQCKGFIFFFKNPESGDSNDLAGMCKKCHIMYVRKHNYNEAF